ncbi:MAG: DNA-formamidopyrimidine glycosylase family protein, partial [Chloroflexota bacterium]
MPELPEVETVVRGLREPLVGRQVQAMWYDWRNTI